MVRNVPKQVCRPTVALCDTPLLDKVPDRCYVLEPVHGRSAQALSNVRRHLMPWSRDSEPPYPYSCIYPPIPPLLTPFIPLSPAAYAWRFT